ncbi:hypothetical protein AB0N62_41935 [Streptomyces sp. NPDC093982]|uniref:hypothetical protein n=1 Tax=Streptomyces sp. NPDC093982 TaxID=3155077 RepID=UPI0034182297
MSGKTKRRRCLYRITTAVTAAALLLGTGVASAADAPAPNGDGNYAPASRPAAGPEKGTRAGGRPASGSKPEAGPTWKQSGSVWQVDRTVAQLRNSVTDPDGDKANLTFEVWTVDTAGKPKAKLKITGQNADPANQGDVSAEYGVIVSKMVASGSKATVTVPHGNLKPATTYAFRTSAYDGSLYETDWSPYATFKTRARQVDITLPAPKRDAPDPAFDTSWQPVPGWGSVQTRDAAGERHCEATAQGDRLCIAWEPATKEDFEAARESRARLKSTRAANPPLHDSCEVGATQGTYLSIFTRDKACMYGKFSVQVTDEAGLEEKGYQEFLYSSHMSTALTGTELKLWARVTPLPMPAGHMPFPAQPGAIKLTISPQCSAGCADKPSYAWDGNLMWGGSYDIDPHEETATATVQWSGGVPDESGKKDSDLSQALAFAPYATFSTSVPETFPTDNSQGFLGNPVFVRCDMVYSPAGCVFRDYMPGYVFNTAKTPAAAAHAWLTQAKIREGAPLSYLPDRRGDTGEHGERNKYGRDPDANRRVICPDSWAAKSGHPSTTPVTDISASDKPSCDEFTFAASYNSGGMPSDMGGTNQVTSGDKCAQTYATKLSDGTWRLYDDERTAAPTWSEVCGRSAMSGWVNSTSMSRFPTFAKELRLIDQDAYFVRTPGFDKCDASKPTIKCDIR